MPFNKANYDTVSFNEDPVQRREVTATVSTIDGSVSRVATLDRSATGFSASIIGTTSRVSTLARSATAFTAALDGSASRVATLDRSPTGHVATIDGSADRAYTGWAIEPGSDDPTMIRPTSLSASATTLSLSFDIPADERDAWRRFDRAGDLSLQTGFGGSYRAIDRAGRSGPTRVEPPGDQEPPFPRSDYIINSYTEQQQSPVREQITLTFQRVSNRDSVFAGVSETGTWELDVHTGTVGLESAQVSTLDGQGSRTGAQYALTVRCDDDQAATLLDSLGYPAGVAAREIGDGENYLDDESPDSRQTVTLTAPSDALLTDGSYFCTAIQIEEHSKEQSRRWAVTMDLQG